MSAFEEFFDDVFTGATNSALMNCSSFSDLLLCFFIITNQ
jgi:hypothetical protein